MTAIDYDCCVVGGGMIGAAAALALADFGYKVALIEKSQPQPYSSDQAPDLRLSALNIHTQQFLESVGAWQHIQSMRYRPYSALSVWDAGSISDEKTRFEAKDIGREHLGYFVENRLVQLASLQQIETKHSDKVDHFNDKRLTNIDVSTGLLRFDDGQELSAKLILGADGANSQVRTSARIAASGWQYKQQANAILIRCESDIDDETWQAFYESGPRALLPMFDNYACLVWYDNKPMSDELRSCTNQQLKQKVLDNFPDLGTEFSVLACTGFPLSRMHANSYGRGKAILVGDSAHTVNPLAGQGVNLGFQDLSVLCEQIQKDGIEHPQALAKAYQAIRHPHNMAMMTGLDVLYKSFSSSSLIMRGARQLGLAVAQRGGILKQQALKYATGVY